MPPPMFVLPVLAFEREVVDESELEESEELVFPELSPSPSLPSPLLLLVPSPLLLPAVGLERLL